MADAGTGGSLLERSDAARCSAVGRSVERNAKRHSAMERSEAQHTCEELTHALGADANEDLPDIEGSK